ncbi:hypothetical protein [Ottowia sp.]|uniref:hypothetical protein n=1 Tax=Ottowia sp. TaxID=1898956 RepID=UPI0025E3C0AA|nr:hypothetical protein [Ottowia sp.]MBK6616314.1 hypothetical protein [Ottowia sp.]
MVSYGRQARQDAYSIAELLDKVVGAPKARELYDALLQDEVRAFEVKYTEGLTKFIQKTASERGVVLRHIGAEKDKVLFAVLAILGCVRAAALASIRDDFRLYLAPGEGNRDTISALYLFSEQIRGVYDYCWPSEIFEIAQIDDGSDEDFEFEPDGVDG